ncbi:MAG TPA: type II toxin-antitoxin system VapC family toxin [Polyangiales bacterium]|jgi:PIN domain nuclease of toxin-antitoxin system|nr:type II toxin-antitoxin system VapC family toxin [Polyangiales bacterium]
MNSYVLDTHAYVLSVSAPKKLGKEALRVMRRIERGQDLAFIPAAVAAELTTLQEIGRIDLGLPELEASLQDVQSLQFLPLDLAQLDTFASLRSVRDPFDRLIVSAALTTGSRLMTKDMALTESGLVETVW